MAELANDIKQKITLEGEREYNAALKEAQRNLKTLRSELRAETAELGKNATEQQKSQVKAKNLQKQIKEQEKAVNTYRAALEEVRKQYGDNADAVAKYEQKLNNARAALADMQNQLDEVGDSYDSITSGAQRSILENNALAESFGRIGDMADGMATAIENVFSGLFSTIKNTVGAVWGEIMDIAAKSDNYLDLASYFGASATEVQKWESAMEGAAGKLSAVTGLITKLKYSGKENSVAEWFGVSAENYTNDLEYFQAVMQQMVDNRDEMIRNGTWNTAMTDIFGGKKAKDAEDVLSDWDKILEGLERFNADEGGYGLSEDQIEKMAELNTQVATLKESWAALKRMATVHLFGDLALNITGNLQNIVDAFKEYFDAGDDKGKKEAAIKKIKENIEAMFEAIRDAIKAGLELLDELATEFENSDDPTSKTIGGLLRGLKNIVEWLADPSHWEDIKKGIEIVFGAWLFTKLTSVASKVSGIVSNLRTISGFKTPSIPTAPAAPAAPAAAPTGGTAAAGTASKASFGAWLADAMGISGAGMAGGMIGTAAWVYGVSELVNYVNGIARKAREVETDANRYAGFGGNDANYAWGGMDNRYVLESYVNSLMKTTGDTRGINGPQSILSRMAGGLGGDILSAFEYTNTSGEKRNKLLDMLNMDDQNAAVAAMMLHAAGISTRDVDYSAQYAKYEELLRSGGMGFSTGLTTLTDFFDKSGIWQDGRWTIPGYENTNGIMPVINGVPLANMSGYVMTSDANKRQYTGSWDPTMHMSDWWQNPGAPGGPKVEMSDSSITGMKRAVADGVSGIRVYMDGVAVGHLVAPTVSEDIARAVP